MTLLRLIRQYAREDVNSTHAAGLVCQERGWPMDLIPRLRRIIQHEKQKIVI